MLDTYFEPIMEFQGETHLSVDFIRSHLSFEHLNHHFLVGLLCCTHQKVMRRCSTGKGAFIINDFLINPHFRYAYHVCTPPFHDTIETNKKRSSHVAHKKI